MQRQPRIECNIDEAIAMLVGLRETHHSGNALLVALSFRENREGDSFATSATGHGHHRLRQRHYATTPTSHFHRYDYQSDASASTAMDELRQRWTEANCVPEPTRAALSASRRRSYTPPQSAIPPKPSATSSRQLPAFRNPSPWNSSQRKDPVVMAATRSPVSGGSSPLRTAGADDEFLAPSHGVSVSPGRRRRQQLPSAPRSPHGVRSSAQQHGVPVFRFDPRNVTDVSVSHEAGGSIAAGPSSNLLRNSLQPTVLNPTSSLGAVESVHISPIRRRDAASPGPYDRAFLHPLLSLNNFHRQQPPKPRDVSGLVSPTPRPDSAGQQATKPPRRGEFFDSSLEVHAVSPRRMNARESPRGRNGVAWVVDFRN